MTIATLLTLALVLGGVQPRATANVAGDWRALDVPIRMHFQTDGSKLSGTVVLGDAAVLPIVDGRIDHDAVNFSLRDDRGGTIAFSGRISGDSIKFAVVGRKFPKTFTAIRAK